VSGADKPHYLHVPNVMEIWETEPPGNPLDHIGPVMGLLYLYLYSPVGVRLYEFYVHISKLFSLHLLCWK